MTMDPRLVPLADILRLNTRLLRNCLDGLSDEQAGKRPSDSTNSAAFVAAHLSDARFYMLQLLGAEQPNPLAAYLKGARGISDVKQFPSLEEIQRAWTTASRALRDRLATVTAAELDGIVKPPFPVPTGDPSMLSLLTFFVQHDSYHIGQLALLRKHAGLPAMQYS
jgi:uncharacterized damage-inducible protein DinB